MVFPEPQKAKKKYVVWIVVIACLVILFIIIGIAAYTGTNQTLTNQTQNVTQIVTPTEIKQNSSALYFFIVLILVGIIGGIIFYLIYSQKISINFGDAIKPVFPDRAFELFKRNIAKKNRMTAYFDEKSNIKFSNPLDFNNPIWIPHKRHDDEILICEFETHSGLNKGTHVCVIPLSKGEDAISGAYFRLNSNTPFSTFKYLPRTYPLVGPRDKQERLVNSLLENEGDIDPQKLQLLQNYSSQFQKTEDNDKHTIDELKSEGEVEEGVEQFAGIRPKKQKKRWTRNNYFGQQSQ